MKTRPIETYHIRFESAEGEIIEETISTDDLYEDETVDDYINDRIAMLVVSDAITWKGEVVREEGFRL